MTITAREFNHDVSAAKRAALVAPVVITDRGEPSHVLMSISEYRRLTGAADDWVSRLQMAADEIDFEPSRMHLEPRIPEL